MHKGKKEGMKEKESGMTKRRFKDKKKRGGIDRSRASGRKHCQKSERDLFNGKKIHNAYCIMQDPVPAFIQ